MGREEVIRHLLREASGMQEPEFTFPRRNGNDRQIIDEFAVRFVFAGENWTVPLPQSGLARRPLLRSSPGRRVDRTQHAGCLEEGSD